jgi:glycosyltransferase involved in cell wall biosynthesis
MGGNSEVSARGLDENRARYSDAFGVVAMAAYQPDLSLFRSQLLSIKNQTHKNFQCLISVDGNPEPLRKFLDAEISDPRFVIVGHEDRLGFYGNFERVLSEISDSPAWVALSDQDDFWYPEKLSLMLPYLDDYVLVSGQARVVDADTGDTSAPTTARRNVPLSDLIAQNQVTGGQTIFRRELLELALPFPRLPTVTEVHDHWLAVCAASSGGALVLDEVVQDYVQHGSNVLGEVGRGVNLYRSFQHVRKIADRFEGGHGFGQMLEASRKLSYGWRQTMVDTLAERLPMRTNEFSEVEAAFSSRHTWRMSVRALLSGYRRGNIATSCLVEFVAGTPGEIARKLRKASR